MPEQKNEQGGVFDGATGVGTAMRTIRATVRARALEAVRRGGEPYDELDLEIAEAQAEVAARRFSEGPGQLEEAPLRRFYATVWADDDLEDLLVGLVATAQVPAAAIPAPPTGLAGQLATMAREAAAARMTPWQVTGRAILAGLTDGARRLLGLPLLEAAAQPGREASIDLRDLAGATERAVASRGPDALVVAEVSAASGDQRLRITLDEPDGDHWRVNAEMLARPHDEPLTAGWQLVAHLDERELGGAFRRDGLWTLEERLTLADLERLLAEVRTAAADDAPHTNSSGGGLSDGG